MSKDTAGQDATEDFFVLNKGALVRVEGEEGKTPLWEAHREYKVDLKRVLLRHDLGQLLHDFDPNKVDLPVSFFGIQLLLDQAYWEKVNRSLHTVKASLLAGHEVIKGIDDGSLTEAQDLINLNSKALSFDSAWFDRK